MLQVGESSLPTDVALLAIDGCRDVVFREAALKKKLNLSDVTVVDVGRVIFDTGSVSHVQVTARTPQNPKDSLFRHWLYQSTKRAA